MQPAAGPTASPKELRLRAEDAEDLAVLSACLQDALVSLHDLAYDDAAGTFVAAANRFCWEDGGADAAGPFARTLCLIAFEGVSGVAYRGFQRGEGGRILSLLAIRATPVDAGMIIDLEFAGGATIRLFAAGIRCRARDFGERWLTSRQPGHALDEIP
jgi:hypothetical protein